MDYIEIILKNTENIKIETVLYDCVFFEKNDIISSHFFDIEKNKDISYQEVGKLKDYFNVPGTCSLYLKRAIIGTELENVLIHIAFDEKYGDITIDFEEKQFEHCNNQKLKGKLQKLLTLLQRICKDGKAEKIILGYEPADDADMKMLVIGEKQMEIFNESIFKSSLANTMYCVAKDIKN